MKIPRILINISVLLSALLTLSACGQKTEVNAIGGDPELGKIALTQYACHACHMIPGITGAKVFVGPSLDGIGSRAMIAGKLPNTTQNMVVWIRHPQVIDPDSAMPDMGVTEEHARHMAAYLASLK